VRRARKLLAASIVDAYFVACWRVVFWLDDYDPDHQDLEAEYDLYAAGAPRSLLSCNDSGQQRPFIFSLGRKQLYETHSNFLAMDGAMACGTTPARTLAHRHAIAYAAAVRLRCASAVSPRPTG
jgi:hypothetical protein